MRTNRKIISEFIAVFLIGAVTGGLVEWCYTDTQLSTFMSRTNSGPAATIARVNLKYANEYHLTPEELNKIQPLIKEMAEHVYDVRHRFGVDMIATLNEYHLKIAAELTPEHRATYLNAVEARQDKIREMLLPDQDSQTPAAKE